MRRLISILLLAVFGLPLLLPMLAVAQDAEAGLPACCRRNGKHHCMLGMQSGSDGNAAGHTAQVTAPARSCPCCPGSVAPARGTSFAAPPAAVAILCTLVSHPTGLAQTQAKWRISRDRSNGKRGPPALTTL